MSRTRKRNADRRRRAEFERLQRDFDHWLTSDDSVDDVGLVDDTLTEYGLPSWLTESFVADHRVDSLDNFELFTQ